MRVFTAFEASGGRRAVVGVGLTFSELDAIRQAPVVLKDEGLPCGVIVYTGVDDADLQDTIRFLLETNPGIQLCEEP